jgi:hypothetical protein
MAAVVIPLSHDTVYTPDQEISFRHVRRHLSRYDIYVVVPESQRGVYPGFIRKPFADRFFGSPEAFGALLLTRDFYRAFLGYECILLYHLDSLVFSDRLQEWCAAGYDYIAPPWLISPDTPHITEEKVGNGGFSLRRVRSFLRVLESRRYFVEPAEYWHKFAARSGRLTRLVNSPRRYLKKLIFLNDIHWHVRMALKGGVHEDRFWAEYATHYDSDFRIAPVDVAMRFAFEAEPRRSFDRIGRQPPFGAHRWQKFDRAFYEPFLLKEGPIWRPASVQGVDMTAPLLSPSVANR